MPPPGRTRRSVNIVAFPRAPYLLVAISSSLLLLSVVTPIVYFAARSRISASDEVGTNSVDAYAAELSTFTPSSAFKPLNQTALSQRHRDVIQDVNTLIISDEYKIQREESAFNKKIEREHESLVMIPNHDSRNISLLTLKNPRKGKRLLEILLEGNGFKSKDGEHSGEKFRYIKQITNGKSGGKRSNSRRGRGGKSDFLVRLMRDQLIMARVYSALAQTHKESQILHELRLRIRESQRTVGEVAFDSDLPRSASERIKVMNQVLVKARKQLYDCSAISKRLRAMVQSAHQQVHIMERQTTFLSQLTAKTVSKGLHCLSLQLNIDYYGLPKDEREFSGQDKLRDNNLFHYALFSDNVLAASVVVNSTISNAKEPWKHVFHIVTDKVNYAAMRMWFLRNPPRSATIEVLNVDNFPWLNSSHFPTYSQSESTSASHNLKYTSILNHLRFYLPDLYPELDKILFLDDDVVVNKDLTPLWSMDLSGKVNGAVEICDDDFHRLDKYLNFSHPQIWKSFDPHSCSWGFGMNVFDLREWKNRDITSLYLKWQSMNQQNQLWKIGTLPAGLITFYNLTYPLDKSWHLLGLGYNKHVKNSELQHAAVLHFSGNMKPWLEIAIDKYKLYWTKYINYNSEILQQCNIT